VLRIGVLGAAGIAPQALLRPARRRDDLDVVAVASRRPGAARTYAAEHGIATAYGSYDELFADPSIDVVYNALPPSEHAARTTEALSAGKHVLCEKPAAMTADEARAMVAAATAAGRRLLEAFHDHHHPLTAHVQGLVASGALGEIESVEGAFAVTIPFDPVSIRHDPTAGGGALMDLGCYPVHWLRSLIGEEPEVVAATATANQLGADESIEATLRFPSGVRGRVFASMRPEKRTASLVVHGERGSLEVDNPVLPHRGHSMRTTIDGVASTWTVGGRETYDYQLDALVRAVVDGEAVATEGADIVANMTVIDAVYAAAGWRRPERVRSAR
jgi:predicted dehydrogenase